MSTTRQPGPWYVGVVAGMVSYVDGAALGGVGIAIVIYQAALGFSPTEVGLGSSVLLVAMAVGSLIGGRMGDRIGRRKIFLATMIVIALGSGFGALGANFSTIVIGIVLIGLGVGADIPVSLATAAEAATDRNRGAILGLSQLLWVIGIIASSAIAVLAGELGPVAGQLIFAHVGVLAVVVFLARLPIPESASWIVQRDLKKRKDTVPVAPKASLRDLFRKPYLGRFIALTVFYSLTNVGALAIGGLGTFTATNVANTTVAAYNSFTILSQLIGVAFAFLFMRVVDTHLRMPFFLVGALVFTSAFLVPAIFGFSLPTMVISNLLIAIGAAFAFQAMFKVWTQERFPTLLRSTATGAIQAATVPVAAVAAAILPSILVVNATAVYLTLAAMILVGTAVGYIAFGRPAPTEFDIEAEMVSADGVADAAPARF